MITVIDKDTRYSRQREAVYSAVVEGATHPTAEDVYLRVRAALPQVSLGTVYRNLTHLAERGRIVKLGSGNEAHYDADIRPHNHAQCTHCGRVFDAPDDVPAADFPAIRDFTVQGRLLIYYGICRDCEIILLPD